MAPFKYKTAKKPKPIRIYAARKPRVSEEPQEQLTGQVQGRSAKAGEERFYRSLLRSEVVIGLVFRKVLGAPVGLPGQLELDFLVLTYFGPRAFEIDDMTFIHRGAGEKAEAAVKDDRRVQILRSQGYNVEKIEHVDAAQLDTDEHARATVARLLRK